MGPSSRTLATQLVVQVSFFLAQWQERHLVVCPNAGISEMCLLSTALALLAGLLPEQALLELFATHVPWIDVDLRCVLLIALSVNGAVYLTCFVTTTLHRLRGDGRRCSRAASELIPVACTVVSAVAWPEPVVAESALPILLIT
eukprot:3338080-Amphidinium_carterae.1